MHSFEDDDVSVLKATGGDFAKLHPSSESASCNFLPLTLQGFLLDHVEVNFLHSPSVQG